MTRFVVRPTSCYESDGYSVVDTNREDEKGRQIGRGLREWQAVSLRDMLNALSDTFVVDDARRTILAVLAPCADAHDDYLPEDEKRASQGGHLREIIKESEEDRSPVAVARDALMRELDTLTHGVQVADCLAVLNTIEDLIEAKLDELREAAGGGA